MNLASKADPCLNKVVSGVMPTRPQIVRAQGVEWTLRRVAIAVSNEGHWRGV